MDYLKYINNKLFINGQFISGSLNKMDVINPSTLEPIGFIAMATKDDVIKSIEAADTAFKYWSKTDAKERVILLESFYENILKEIDMLSYVLTLEQGKPINDAKKEIIYGANFIKWFASEIHRINGITAQGNTKDNKIPIDYEPIGVVGAITPWNFPSAMITRKLAPALAAGCTVVLKPSELTPFSALLLANIANKSGIPAGVINIVTGEANMISDIFARDKRVRKISFTGSTKVGKILYKKSSDTIKKLSLELGGNAPVIICEDANIESTIENLFQAKIRSTGQACTSPNRIFIHESIYDIIISMLAEKFKNLTIGDGFNLKVNIGPLINKSSVAKIDILIKDAIFKGAKVICGGFKSEFYYDANNIKTKATDSHNFYEPTIIIDCNEEMNIFNEEIFGPVLAFYKYKQLDEAIELANKTDYGLSAYLYTQDNSKAYKISEQLDYGIIGINEALISNEIGAFAGRKESGFGIEGSVLGIYEYLQTKYKLCKY